MALAFFVVFCWLACVCLHEFGHALVAYFGGDDSVKSKGYLTLNFARYIDPSLSLIFPALVMAMGGIGLPGAAVYINESKLRGRGWRSAVAAAGPLTTFFVTVLLSLPISQQWLSDDNWLSQALALVILFNVATTLLNLLPLPPLDGYGIIRPWLSDSARATMSRFSGTRTIVLIYLLFAFVPVVNDSLWALADMITESLGVSRWLVIHGYQAFRQYSMAVIPVLLLGLWIMGKRGMLGTKNAAAPEPPAGFTESPLPPASVSEQPVADTKSAENRQG